MNFVCPCVKRCDEPRKASVASAPAPHIPAPSAPEKRRENCIASDMTGFADGELNFAYLRFRDGWPNEAEDRADEAGGLAHGAEVRGKRKDQGHPDQHGQPVFGEEAPGHARMKPDAMVWGNANAEDRGQLTLEFQ